jgi:uridylate kinase
MKHKDAKRYDRVSHAEALQKRLGVMDAEAFSLCEANTAPIIVPRLSEKGAVKKAVLGQRIGTLVA